MAITWVGLAFDGRVFFNVQEKSSFVTWMLERVKVRKPPNRTSFLCQAYAAPAFTPRSTVSIRKLRGHKFKLCRKKGGPVDFVHAERLLD